jgi:hypothetical protein
MTDVAFSSEVKYKLCRILQQSEVRIHLVFNLEIIENIIVRFLFIMAIYMNILSSGT